MRWFVVTFLFFLNLLIWWKSDLFLMLNGNGDFWDARNYLQTIQDVKKGLSPYELSYMQTLGPPLVIVPYLSLSLFSVRVALALFTIISVVAGYLSCWLLVKKYWQGHFLLEKTLLLAAGLFSAFPTRFNFITGQWGLVSVLALTIFLTTKSHKVQGVMVGLLMVLKTFFVFGLLGVRSKKIVIGTLLTVVITVVVCMPILKLEHYMQYEERFAGVMWQPDRVINLAYYNQSLKTTLSRLGAVESSVPIWIGAAVLAAIYSIWSGNVGAAIVFSVVLSPVAWQHYFVVLFPLLVTTLSKVKHDSRWLLVWVLSGSLWWAEFPWLHYQETTVWTALLASHYLISALLLSSILVYNYHHEN